jgi:cytosine/adenosine deaminase-related metal-dependent hydrolase
MDCFQGRILTEDGLIDGYLSAENGIITEISKGRCPETPMAEGIILPRTVNAHTHCADGAVKARKGMTLEELVAPPNGLKHAYLRNATEEEICRSIGKFANDSRVTGTDRFIDFREGGVKGCRMLRETCPDAVILGRPISPEFDPNEIDDILEIADGIGIPSLSDMNNRYIEKVADRVREKGKLFAIHVSERVREDIDEVLSLDPAFVVHMTEATDGDILKCAEAEVRIVVCARSNQFFGKIPPVKRMLDCGASITAGTDNAMLCEPDMRAEYSVLMNILSEQGGDPGSAFPSIVSEGRKIIYKQNTLHLRAGRPSELVVYPCGADENVLKALSCKDRILTYPATEK